MNNADTVAAVADLDVTEADSPSRLMRVLAGYVAENSPAACSSS